MDNDDDVFGLVESLSEGAVIDLHKVTIFEGGINGPGGTKSLRITILDAGPGASERYTVAASVNEGEPGEHRSGGEGKTLKIALGLVMWDQLLA